ncbi:MAG: response regulator transcription factor [Prolixibacteraceae bacterium]|nr:response regulator transcription factor [Prolixibacteraceae bacterium]
MRIAIVDGLLNRRLEYKSLIGLVDEHAEISECSSAEDALFSILDQPVDAILCSEILPFRNAFELARVVKTLPEQIPVIVVAEDDTNALTAIKVGVFDFLLNPVAPSKLKLSLEKIARYHTRQLQHQRRNLNDFTTKIKLNTIHGYKLIPLGELAFCQADGSYTIIGYSNGDTDLSSYNLGKIGAILDEYQFARISRSCIVNLRKVERIDRRDRLCLLRMDNELRSLKVSLKQIDLLEEKQIL